MLYSHFVGESNALASFIIARTASNTYAFLEHNNQSKTDLHEQRETDRRIRMSRISILVLVKHLCFNRRFTHRY